MLWIYICLTMQLCQSLSLPLQAQDPATRSLQYMFIAFWTWVNMAHMLDTFHIANKRFALCCHICFSLLIKYEHLPSRVL